jgi:hypothetical protein
MGKGLASILGQGCVCGVPSSVPDIPLPEDAARSIKPAKILKDRLLGCQNLAVKVGTEVEEGQWNFLEAWMLLDECDRQTHLSKGLEEACNETLLGVDGRAMCPDINIPLMLKRQGRAYIDFFGSFVRGKKLVGENAIYQIPSVWWEAVIDQCTPLSQESSSSEEVSSPETRDVSSQAQENSPFALLTLQRNEFIGKSMMCSAHVRLLIPYIARFLMYSTMSVLQDLVKGSPSMDPVLSILKSEFGRGVGTLFRMKRDKPLMRCERCTKCPEDIGEDVKFMMCSVCKKKLDFAVYYCSQYVLFIIIVSLRIDMEQNMPEGKLAGA